MIYNINDKDYANSKTYQDFLRSNPALGYLRIRAYAASQAVPISGLEIVVTTKINNDDVIFFDGYTNDSGIIDNISLPAPRIKTNNLEAPKYLTYYVTAIYGNIKQIYKINIYENISVVQNINITPELQVGGFNGS